MIFYRVASANFTHKESANWIVEHHNIILLMSLCQSTVESITRYAQAPRRSGARSTTRKKILGCASAQNSALLQRSNNYAVSAKFFAAVSSIYVRWLEVVCVHCRSVNFALHNPTFLAFFRTRVFCYWFILFFYLLYLYGVNLKWIYLYKCSSKNSRFYGGF